jgi:CDP-glycerol glycerophosphotransferase (TagB/SpsB family)
VPHPHRRWTDRYDTDTDLTVFREADVYDLIARAEVVIGEVSTVLIEAAFLGADVFVWSSEHPLAQHFPQFGDRAELRAMMQDERPTVPTVEFIRPGGLERQRAAIAEIFRREGIDGLC